MDEKVVHVLMEHNIPNTANPPEGKPEGKKPKTIGKGGPVGAIPSTQPGGDGRVMSGHPAQSTLDVCPAETPVREDWTDWSERAKEAPQPSAKKDGGAKRAAANAKRNKRRKEARLRERMQQQEGEGPELTAAISKEPAPLNPGSSVGEVGPTAKPRTAGSSGKGMAKDLGRGNVGGPANAKRGRPNETISPKVDPKRQKLSQSRGPKPKSYAAAVQASESKEIAVTSANRRFITRETAAEIEEFLLAKIDEMAGVATSASVGKGPMFRGRPTYMDGSLRLICEDDRTVTWVRTCLEEFSHPESIIALGPGEIPRRVRIGIVFPGLETDTTLVGKRLFISNPWANVRSWVMHSVHRQEKHSATFMVFSIPEDQVMEIIARERRLCYRLGSVYVKFRDSKGRYVAAPPGNESAPALDEGATSTPQKAGEEQGEGATTSAQPAPIRKTVQLEEEELLAGVEMELEGEDCQDGVIPF